MQKLGKLVGGLGPLAVLLEVKFFSLSLLLTVHSLTVTFLGEDFILMLDKGRPHKAIIVTKYLKVVIINILGGLEAARTLILLRTCGICLRDVFQARDPSPRTIMELKVVLKQEWEKLP